MRDTQEAPEEVVIFADTLRLRIQPALKQRLRAAARANKRKTADWVREQLWKAVDAAERTEGVAQ